MTIEEAILHCQEVAKESKEAALSYARENAYETEISCKACGQEHEQLAKWLTELKQRREQEKHGRWIPYGRDNDYTKYFRCSSCDYEIAGYAESDNLIKYNYCPNCGAKMSMNESMFTDTFVCGKGGD